VLLAGHMHTTTPFRTVACSLPVGRREGRDVIHLITTYSARTVTLPEHRVFPPGPLYYEAKWLCNPNIDN